MYLLDIRYGRKIVPTNSIPFNCFEPYSMWNMELLENIKEWETIDFGQMNQRAGICNGFRQFPIAHARSSIIALC
jgi:hypothetical protein